MIPFTSLIKELPNIAKLASQLRDLAQHNPNLIRELQKWGLDPTQPPQDPEAIYAWALVKYYDESKPKPIIKFFGEEEIRKAFLSDFNSNNLQNFLNQAKDFITCKGWNNDFQEANIILRAEVQDFYNYYTQVAKWTRPIKDVLSDPSFQKISQYSPYPDEFKALIGNKTESFYGRKFVFNEIQQFISNNPSGYFTVVGDAGIGKSTIAAKYVLDNQTPCYFNERSTGRNTPELFLKSLRQQLIDRYWLQKADDADLPTLLQKVSDNLLDGERLAIVVDALDEVEQKERDKNILSLPKTLPPHVYFLLTRRPYNQDNKRLSVDTPVQELDLRKKYVEQSLEDVKGFIWSFGDKHKDALTKWIEERHISAKEFVDQVAKKSENNFMYLRYVLPAIAKGEYKDLSLKQLPDGLQDYYQQHWVRMEMDNEAKDLKVIILFILVEIGKPIPCKMIAGIAEQDEYEVQTVLHEWVEYLRKLEIKGIDCYTIYHASFLDFLKNKRELQPTRKPFREVNQRIVDFFKQMQQRRQQRQAEISPPGV